MCTKDHGQRVSGRDLAASAWSGCAQVREPPEATQVRPQTLTSSRVRVPAVRDGVIPCVPTGVAFQISRLQLARGGGQERSTASCREDAEDARLEAPACICLLGQLWVFDGGAAPAFLRGPTVARDPISKNGCRCSLQCAARTRR